MAKQKKVKKVIIATKAPLNDGLSSPVPDRKAPVIRSESEAALYKQAESPLGEQ
jgi:hypothetical protein